MEPDVLLAHLHQLHQELADVSRGTPPANPLVATLMRDIERLMSATQAHGGAATGLERDAQSADAAAPPSGMTAGGLQTPLTDEPLPQRLEEIAVHFEAQHPTLAASSRRLMDLLVKAGI